MKVKVTFRRSINDIFLKEFSLSTGSTLELYRDDDRDYRVFVRIDGRETPLGMRDRYVSERIENGEAAPIEFVVRDDSVEFYNRGSSNNPKISNEGTETELQASRRIQLIEDTEIKIGMDLEAHLKLISNGTNSTGLSPAEHEALAQMFETAITVADTKADSTKADTRAVRNQIEQTIDVLSELDSVSEEELSNIQAKIEAFGVNEEQTESERRDRLSKIEETYRQLVISLSESNE